MRTTRLVLISGIIGLLIPVAATSSASAVDQDLQASSTAGAARSEVTLTSASCPTGDPVGDTAAVLTAQLISGTAPNEVLAGFATAFFDTDATIVIPDWIDPTEPAVIEAQCQVLSISDSGEITQTTFDYDPIPFDVEASADAPVQERSFSRASLLAGQGFAVDASGCFLDDAEYGSVEVVPGSDLTLRGATDVVGAGEGEIEGDAFQALTAMANGYVRYEETEDGGLTLTAVPTDIPPGAYTAVPYCSNEDVSLVYEPQVIEITGSAPVDDAALTVPAESRAATFAGGSCATGPVSVQMDGWDLDEELEPDSLADRTADLARRPLRGPSLAAALGQSALPGAPTASDALSGERRSGNDRGLADDGYVETELTPVDGSWSFTDSVDFDHGYVEGYALCGDPLADGFLYDPQVAPVSVTAETSTTTTTTTAPAPAPANAVAGTPTYAG